LPRLCRSTARLPPIHRRPLGFAPPPHDGFAFLASTPMRVPCYEHTIHGFAATHNTPWRMYSACRRCSPVLLCATLSLMPALLPRSDEFRMNSWRNFLEFHAGNVDVGGFIYPIAPARKAYSRRDHNTAGRYYLNLMYDGLCTLDTLHKTTCCIGPGLCIMLEMNFRESPLAEVPPPASCIAPVLH
jgi:hypothetical protein